MTGISETSLPSRCDLTAPAMVFGGLFISAIAICSTLDAASPTISAEPQVVTDEHVVGPQGSDPHASTCDDRSGKRMSKNCSRPRITKASFKN